MSITSGLAPRRYADGGMSEEEQFKEVMKRLVKAEAEKGLGFKIPSSSKEAKEKLINRMMGKVTNQPIQKKGEEYIYGDPNDGVSFYINPEEKGAGFRFNKRIKGGLAGLFGYANGGDVNTQRQNMLAKLGFPSGMTNEQLDAAIAEEKRITSISGNDPKTAGDLNKDFKDYIFDYTDPYEYATLPLYALGPAGIYANKAIKAGRVANKAFKPSGIQSILSKKSVNTGIPSATLAGEVGYELATEEEEELEDDALDQSKDDLEIVNANEEEEKELTKKERGINALAALFKSYGDSQGEPTSTSGYMIEGTGASIPEITRYAKGGGVGDDDEVTTKSNIVRVGGTADLANVNVERDTFRYPKLNRAQKRARDFKPPKNLLSLQQQQEDMRRGIVDENMLSPTLLNIDHRTTGDKINQYLRAGFDKSGDILTKINQAKNSRAGQTLQAAANPTGFLKEQIFSRILRAAANKAGAPGYAEGGIAKFTEGGSAGGGMDFSKILSSIDFGSMSGGGNKENETTQGFAIGSTDASIPKIKKGDPEALRYVKEDFDKFKTDVESNYVDFAGGGIANIDPMMMANGGIAKFGIGKEVIKYGLKKAKKLKDKLAKRTKTKADKAKAKAKAKADSQKPSTSTDLVPYERPDRWLPREVSYLGTKGKEIGSKLKDVFSRKENIGRVGLYGGIPLAGVGVSALWPDGTPKTFEPPTDAAKVKIEEPDSLRDFHLQNSMARAQEAGRDKPNFMDYLASFPKSYTDKLGSDPEFAQQMMAGFTAMMKPSEGFVPRNALVDFSEAAMAEGARQEGEVPDQIKMMEMLAAKPELADAFKKYSRSTKPMTATELETDMMAIERMLKRAIYGEKVEDDDKIYRKPAMEGDSLGMPISLSALYQMYLDAGENLEAVREQVTGKT
tara:strand:- start:231 stop:2945 length:2715 start_codon:yes stop_codon:yes gene_type:complete